MVPFMAGMIAQVGLNQGRLKTIGMWYTVNGTGAISGISRIFAASGQALGPIVSVGLYRSVGWWAPWLFAALLEATGMALYWVLGVSLFSEPEPPPSFVPATPAAARAVASVEEPSAEEPPKNCPPPIGKGAASLGA